MTDLFSMLAASFSHLSHLELNRTWNNDHRLTLAIDVPSTVVLLRRRFSLLCPERGQRELYKSLVDALELILIPPLMKQGENPPT